VGKYFINIEEHIFMTLKIGEKISYEGNTYSISRINNDNTISVTTEDGQTITIPKSAPLFSWYYEQTKYYTQMLNEDKDKISEYETLISQYKETLKDIKDKIHSYLVSWGVTNANQLTNSSQKSQYEEMVASANEAKGEKTSASNELYSTAMHAFNTALDKGKVLNAQLVTSFLA
jgi:Lhr-like helicase